MDIDQAIAKMESDLASLRRARELMGQYSGSSSRTSSATPTNGVWHDALPAMLRDHSMTVREIEMKLKGQYPYLAYSTIFSWMKRATARGEYVKRAKKFRYNEASKESSEDA